MEIRIDDTFSVLVEDKVYTLREDKGLKNKKGETVYINHGYFSNLEHLLNKLVTLEVIRKNSGEVMELKGYVEELKEARRELEEVLKGEME